MCWMLEIHCGWEVRAPALRLAGKTTVWEPGRGLGESPSVMDGVAAKAKDVYSLAPHGKSVPTLIQRVPSLGESR